MYRSLVSSLKPRVHVLSEIFADDGLQAAEAKASIADATIWQNDNALITECDAVIAEVTTPSLGVGYEIAKAEAVGKPVLALFRDTGKHKLSAMIGGAPGVTVGYYRDLAGAEAAVDTFLQKLTEA